MGFTAKRGFSATARTTMADPDTEAGETLSGQAERALLRAILSGELPPDTRLTIPALQERFGFGATPLREGLSRLTSSGLVMAVGNRGFRVAPMNPTDLRDILGTRAVIETGALQRSMRTRSPEWEEAVVVAMLRLKRVVERNTDVVSESNAEFAAAHRNFHVALISGCGLQRLMDIQATIYDQSYRYWHGMVMAGMEVSRVVAEHQKLVDCALGDDIPLALKALEDHLALPIEKIFPGEVSA